MITAELNGSTIRIRFPYNKQTVLQVHQIVDVRWNKSKKFWYCPASPWHAELLFKVFPGVVTDKYVKHLARCMPYLRIMSSTKDHPQPDNGLYPYQMAGVEYIEACNGRALIADSTGTGKTVVVLHWAKTKGDEVKKILIVCPGSVKYKWSDEIKKWYSPSADFMIVDSPVVPHSNILIMSYDRMRTTSQELFTRDFDLIILDEIQAIKNPKSQRGSAARKIASRARYVIGMSATPTPNRPMELFNELHTIRAWEYPSSWTFGSRYAGGVYEYSGFKGTSNAAELKDRLSSIMIRRKKADVLSQLPSLTRSVMWTDLPKEDRVFYSSVEFETKQAIKLMNPLHKGYFANVLDKITALREAVGIAKSSIVGDFINDLLEEDEQLKLVVSCYFMTTIGALASKLSQPPAIITGKDTHHQRELTKERFRRPNNERVLIMSSVGSEGIDLFGLDGADVSSILTMDRQWTATAEEQAEGRLHRIGQESPVTSYYINAAHTIDVHMDRIVERKRLTGFETNNQGEIVNEIVRELLSSQ